jgi:hypothetical protein
MATEKLAKAEACSTIGGPPPRSHKGFSEFIRKGARRHREALSRRMKLRPENFDRLILSLAPLSRKIESLAPNLAGEGPNTEYPWSSGDVIHVPAETNFVEITQMEAPRLRKLLRFLDGCFEVFS